MKAALLLVLSGLLSSTIAWADGSVVDGTQPPLRRLNLPAIKDITIEENGAKSPAAKDSPEECGAFILNKRDVRE